MRRHGCTVDIENNVLIIQGKKFDLNHRESIGCYRVMTKEYEIMLKGFRENNKRQSGKYF